jgi:flagellar basal-body rod modification protein FlgD
VIPASFEGPWRPTEQEKRENIMLSAIQAMQSADTQTTGKTTPSATDAMGKDAFLKIFLAQMQHQDPLNPMEGTEFTAQLAQFSSLEQLYNVNENLESLKGAEDDANRSDALNYIGKEIMAKGDQLSLGDAGSATGAFQIQESADCTVQVVDSAGNLVRSIPLGTLDAGQHTFDWDGLNSSGLQQPSGVYSFTVSAVGETGDAVLADTMASGKVTRVSVEGESPVLYLGDMPVDFDQVLDITLPEERDGS